MMSKEENSKTRYCVQWNAHERYMCTVLCSLMEHQSLVDLAICCGNSTIHVHKCILAANSTYFREQLEKNTTAEQVIINGLDFLTIKSIIEFIYCGETIVPDDNMKYMIAAAKVFQIRGLQALASEVTEFSGGGSGDQVYIPPPVFISKKPKYPNAFRPFNTFSTHQPSINKNAAASYDQILQRKVKRKYMRSEAERACAKEAAASRQALEALQKELAIQPQVNSFVIEESCTETTVENFIPHTDDRYVENIRDFQNLPVVNYYNVGGPGYQNRASMEKSFAGNPLLHFNIRADANPQGELTTDKVKNVLGNDISNNVEIMFKTSEGDFVSVTDEILQNITKSALQYQVIDENGMAGEMQELRVLNKVIVDPSDMSHKFVYDQDTLNPSQVETTLNGLPKLHHNTTISDEPQAENKNTSGVNSNPTDSTDLIEAHGSKQEIESCFGMLKFPRSSANAETCDPALERPSVFVAEKSLPQLSVCDLSNSEESTLDCGAELQKHQTESGVVFVPEKKQKLMLDSERDNVPVNIEISSHYDDTLSLAAEFSPRKTRSTTVKCLNKASIEGEESEEKGDSKRDKTKRCSLTRKVKSCL